MDLQLAPRQPCLAWAARPLQSHTPPHTPRRTSLLHWEQGKWGCEHHGADNAINRPAQLSPPCAQSQRWAGDAPWLSQKTAQTRGPGAHRPLGRLLTRIRPIPEPGSRVPAGRGGCEMTGPKADTAPLGSAPQTPGPRLHHCTRAGATALPT